MKISTVKIQHEDGFAIINESDFNESKHVLLDSADTNGDGRVTVKELKAALDDLSIEYPKGAKKAELETLLGDSE